MKKVSIIIFVIIGIIVFSSCENQIENYNPDREGTKYFPLKTGNTWIYSVDSIIYDRAGTIVDTIHHVVKEIITSSFEDNEGNTNYQIERYTQENKNWIISDIWFAMKNETQAIRNEDNLRFIKMIFPIKDGINWDGNSYIDSENIIVKIAGEPIKMYNHWLYRYIRTDDSETIGNNVYDNVCVIQQVDDENSIQKRYSLEKYVKDIGLVYKEMIILNTQIIDDDIPWDQKAEQGFILTQTLISFSE